MLTVLSLKYNPMIPYYRNSQDKFFSRWTPNRRSKIHSFHIKAQGPHFFYPVQKSLEHVILSPILSDVPRGNKNLFKCNNTFKRAYPSKAKIGWKLSMRHLPKLSLGFLMGWSFLHHAGFMSPTKSATLSLNSITRTAWKNMNLFFFQYCLQQHNYDVVHVLLFFFWVQHNGLDLVDGMRISQPPPTPFLKGEIIVTQPTNDMIFSL